jgi:hypothetical protein
MNYNMKFKLLVKKIRNRIHVGFISIINNSRFQFKAYPSYWHSRIARSKFNQTNNPANYFAACPNAGAGIGHQLANWIAGYWWAKQFGLRFAHLPFSNSKWDLFLGFGENEENVERLIQNGYKRVRLPLFNENRLDEVELIKSIIASYNNKRVVFIAEQDQAYMQQYGVMAYLKHKFNAAKARMHDKLVYNENNYNIAVHVRRTVIIDGVITLEDDAAKSLRWLANDYYEKVLIQVLDNIKVNKPIDIYLFSTGKPEEFAEFSKYGNIKFCSDMDEYTSFLHLVRADLLITSKSSFSYKPALMNGGIKICPRNFWHGYPDTKDWILVENDGTFDVCKLNNCL